MKEIEQKIPNLVPGDNVIGDSAKSHLINGISPVLKAYYFGPFYTTFPRTLVPQKMFALFILAGMSISLSFISQLFQYV